MTPSKLERKWTAQVFHTLVTDTRQRLVRGSQLRQQMRDQINAGKKPSGYRPDWIWESAISILSSLRKLAGEFNEKHPADQASSDDLLDVLATAINMIQNNSKKEVTVEESVTAPKSQA